MSTITSIANRLPPYFKTNPTFQHILEQTCKAKVMFSLLLYSEAGKDHLFYKDGTIHAPLDWQAFSIMRSLARLLIASGPTVRAEKGVYMTRESYGDKHVDELYQSLIGNKPQKLVILSKTMAHSELLDQVNPELYELQPYEPFSSFAQFVRKISSENQTPVLVESGLKTMKQYYEQVLNGAPNSIDTIMLSRFQGPLPVQFKGDPVDLPFTTLYDHTWTSEAYPCIIPGNIKGKLTLHTYNIKKQSKQ